MCGQSPDSIDREVRRTLGIFECRIAEGRIDARKKGLAEGREKALIEIAVGLRNDGVPMEIIERRTGLTKEQIAAL